MINMMDSTVLRFISSTLLDFHTSIPLIHIGARSTSLSEVAPDRLSFSSLQSCHHLLDLGHSECDSIDLTSLTILIWFVSFVTTQGTPYCSLRFSIFLHTSRVSVVPLNSFFIHFTLTSWRTSPSSV
ncbi:hypothetical protein BLNAU_10721 [Blattamonas nauphoetae]|uniref:Uncharacterized protein n=1 Tax=Blattamonas nauphoetae TaxID=2049346 RepID=A0ABQ9XRN6_9EUKA|nr:hypothetical protein BLNAU_10721 [Blattamonas nauphoetae]